MTTARIMAAALASIAAFLLGNSYAACLLSLPGSPAVNLTEAAKRLPSFLLGHGPLSLEAAALATGLVAACAVWCAWAWSLTHGNPERQGEEHGSARWGTVREGRRFMNLEDPDRNIVLTKHFGMAMDRPDHDRRFERNRNVLVVGGSGSGKTRGFFEPNIMQLNSNHLVTDPKGETLPRMGHMWRGDGRGRCRDGRGGRDNWRCWCGVVRLCESDAVPELGAAQLDPPAALGLAAPEGLRVLVLEPVQPQVEGRRAHAVELGPLHHARVAGEELLDLLPAHGPALVWLHHRHRNPNLSLTGGIVPRC